MIIEYGAMSSKYSIEADNKLTGYAGIIMHFRENPAIVAIYSPTECRADSWLMCFGRVEERLDEVFGGKGAFLKYLDEHKEEVRKAYESIKKLV